MAQQDDDGSSGVAGARGQLLSDYVPRHELAAEFDVSERTIDRWVAVRLLPAPLILGRKRLFHVPTVKQHLAELVSSRTRARRRG